MGDNTERDKNVTQQDSHACKNVVSTSNAVQARKGACTIDPSSRQFVQPTCTPVNRSASQRNGCCFSCSPLLPFSWEFQLFALFSAHGQRLFFSSATVHCNHTATASQQQLISSIKSAIDPPFDCMMQGVSIANLWSLSKQQDKAERKVTDLPTCHLGHVQESSCVGVGAEHSLHQQGTILRQRVAFVNRQHVHRRQSAMDHVSVGDEGYAVHLHAS